LLPIRDCFDRGERSRVDPRNAGFIAASLRLAAVVLFTGSALFLVRHLISIDYRSPTEVFLLALHVVTTAILGFFAVAFCMRREVPLWKLRVAEFCIFGMPALFFAAITYSVTYNSCQRGSFDLLEGRGCCWFSPTLCSFPTACGVRRESSG